MGGPLKNRLDELLAEQRRLVGLLEAHNVDPSPPPSEPEPVLPGLDSPETWQAAGDALTEAGIGVFQDDEAPPTPEPEPAGPIEALTAEITALREQMNPTPDTRNALERMSDALDAAGMFRSGRWAPNGADDDA
jgi:hypothetical protein